MMFVNFEVVVVLQCLVVVLAVVIGGVLSLVVDFRDVMMALPPELAHLVGGCLSLTYTAAAGAAQHFFFLI